MTEEQTPVVLYPPGGAFNKLRNKQTFALKAFLADHIAAYENSDDKKEYVLEHVLGNIPGGLWFWKGNADTGCRVRPVNIDEAYEKISQKLRDVKKVQSKKRKVVPASISEERDQLGEQLRLSDIVSLLAKLNCAQSLCHDKKAKVEELMKIVEENKHSYEEQKKIITDQKTVIDDQRMTITYLKQQLLLGKLKSEDRHDEED